MEITEQGEKEILQSPGTHRLVGEVLDLVRDKDPVDAYYDVLLASEILKGRMKRSLEA